MIEPTESEPLAEMDRFCEAMLQIRAEIAKVEAGTWPQEANPLSLAPHTADDVVAADWERPYTRAEAIHPLPWVRQGKYWPPVGRVDQVHGDRNLECVLAPDAELG